MHRHGKNGRENSGGDDSAIEFHVEGLIENGDDLPRPRSLNSYLLETDEISANDILTSVEVEIPALALA